MTTTAERPIDPDVLQRRASNPEASVWVGASAGSGKTKVLTDRVLRLLLAGTAPERLLCLTFTKAAAAEMAIRVNRVLAQWATMDDDRLTDALAALTGRRPAAGERTTARRLFARVVDCPGSMKIQTIHAFCQSLLRRFPLESGLAPHFDVMDDRTAALRLREARDAVLGETRLSPEGALGRAVARLTGDLNAESFSELMAELTGQRGRIARLLERHGGRAAAVLAVRSALGLAPGETEESVLNAACAGADEPALRDACRALAGGSDSDGKRGIAIQSWLDAADRTAGFEIYAAQYLTGEGTPRKTLLTKKPATANPAALAALEGEAERLIAARERIKAAGVAASTEALLVFAEALLARYEAGKRASALLDYDDLIHNAGALLADERVPWVLFKLDGGLDHILIDEAQDTNPEQWRVVKALAGEFFAGADARRDDGIVRTLFVVGDAKQSIFSFQRADPAEFARMRRHFEERIRAAERAWDPVDLDISFRSTAAVLGAVDAVFALDDARDGVAPDAVRHRPFRAGHAGEVELWPLIAPRETEEGEAWALPLARERADAPSARLAAVIAATIRGWVEQGERLPARDRPIRPGDVLVLVRRRSAFVAELVRALKEQGVPVAGVDRMVLRDQLAVRDLLALASFLLLPDDDLTLATVLKGPLIGLGEEALFDLAWNRTGSLWRALIDRADRDPALVPIRAYLERLLSRSDFAPPYEFFAGVLASPCPADENGGRRAILGRLGPDAQDPLDEFLAATLTFERAEPPSLQLFLDWLTAGESEIKREMEQGADVVRIMTVHGSKGLQAPIVFLPDTVATPRQSPTVLWPDGEAPDVPLYAARRSREEGACAAARARADRRRDQEHRRLFYVALTRAEDRLYVCGWQGKTKPADHCWYRLAERALAGYAQPQEFDFAARSPQGWSGTGYRFADQQTAAARGDGLAAADAAVEADIPLWARAAPEREPEPSRPLSPSKPEEDEPAVRSPLGEEDDGRRFQRGLLVHRLLQTLPDLAPGERAEACRRFLARPAHDLDPGYRERLAAETLAVIEHPDFAHLFAPGSRGEVPVVGLAGDRAVSGRIDRLAVDGDTVWVAEYKTNRPPPRRAEDVPPVYLKQMEAYRAVLAGIYPGKTIRGVFVWTDGPFALEV
jgi:ATP-dependent helicase/nuclease subunit A